MAANEENQNSLDTSEEDSQLSAVRDVIVELKEMYNEFLLQIKLVQKDLIRSSKYDELEAKVLKLNSSFLVGIILCPFAHWHIAHVIWFSPHFQCISTMLELQSIQKDQKRRELLAKIQRDDDSIEVTVPLRKGIQICGTNPADELRSNNNHDELQFENDAIDDDTGTTVADDIILMNTNTNTNANVGVVGNESTSATITVMIDILSE